MPLPRENEQRTASATENYIGQSKNCGKRAKACLCHGKLSNKVPLPQKIRLIGDMVEADDNDLGVEYSKKELNMSKKQLDSKQLNRIKRMESCLDEAVLTVKELSLALEKYEKLEKKYYKLENYYGSSAWLDDFEADEEGLIPQEIKRGVLSEDAVYNLIVEHKELMRRMQRAVLRSME